MNPPGGSKYLLTPCRTFGLKRTYRSKGLSPTEGASGLINSPFRSPLTSASSKSTPSAQEKPSSLAAKSPWSTPLLPKSRVKMGLSKPSGRLPNTPKQCRSLIETSPVGSDPNRRSSLKKLVKVNCNEREIAVKTAEASRTLSDSSESSDENVEDGKQTDGGVQFQPASKAPPSVHDDSSEDTPLETSRIDRLSEPSSRSESEDASSLNQISPLAKTTDEISTSQESFRGWDENAQDSDDAKRKIFLKCLSNFNNIVPAVQRDDEPKCNSPRKQPVGARKKFKRRVLSDSDETDEFSVDKENSQQSGASELSKLSENLAEKALSRRCMLSATDDENLVHKTCNEDGEDVLDQAECTGGKSAVEELNINSSYSAEIKSTDSRLYSDEGNESETVADNEFRRRSVTAKKNCSNKLVSSDSDDDHNFVRKPPKLIGKSNISRSKSKRGLTSSSDDYCDSVANISIKSKRKSRLKVCLLSDSDDDNFVVKSRNMLEKVEISSEEGSLVKSVPVVELRRLPESVLQAEGNSDLSEASFSEQGSSSPFCDSQTVEDTKLPTAMKTYGGAVKKENPPKNPRALTSKIDQPGAEELITLRKLRLQSDVNVKPELIEDGVNCRLIENISETEDLERMKNEMQKWLAGGQQVISQIIEEVRLQKDKNMTVMEVLAEQGINPDLVGYDPIVEEFICFDKFLLKNNLT